MKVKDWKKIDKGIIITKAIIAPGLILLGYFTNNNILEKVGVIWCVLIVLRTALSAGIVVDSLFKADGHLDDDEY